MSKPVISVENLSKLYRIGLKEEIPDTLVGAMTSFIKSPLANFRQLRRLDTFAASNNDNHEDTLWALKDVSFDIEEGDVVGIIGRNGAGKSTLLKILSRITEPTSGRIVMRGRVSSLLEVGTGFHPELSGRENIYMNGTILGMTKREIDSKFDEIVDFSGVERFLDTPVKRYSSGMMVRLAFAVAAHLEPEILIVDEVLAVGDAEFQKKCIGKMQDVAGQGRTVLFVSHNLPAMQSLCKKSILLSNGTQSYIGTTTEGIELYLQSNSNPSKQEPVGNYDLTERTNTYGNGEIIAVNLSTRDETGNPKNSFLCSRPMIIEVNVIGLNKHKNAQVGIIIRTIHGEWIANYNTGMNPPSPSNRKHAETVKLNIPRIPINPGLYKLDVSIAEKATGRIDYIEGAAEFRIEPFDVYGTGYSVTAKDGIIYLEGTWSIE